MESGRLLPSEKGKVLKMAAALGEVKANFASENGEITAEDQYLKDLEDKEPTAMFSSFQEPLKGQPQSGFSGSKIISKL